MSGSSFLLDVTLTSTRFIPQIDTHKRIILNVKAGVDSCSSRTFAISGLNEIAI
jgi:hypothetical protein